MNQAMSNLVYWEVSLPKAGVLELADLQGPFQVKEFSDSVILTHENSQAIKRQAVKLTGYFHHLSIL